MNWNSPDSIHNVLSQLSFYCAPGWVLGLLGMAFILGIVVGCVTVTRMGDIWGRKYIFMAGLALNAVLTVVIVFSDMPWLDTVMFFFMGYALTMIKYVGYAYMVEMMPAKYDVLAGTIQFLFTSVIYICCCLYFMLISRRWRYLMIADLVLSIFGVVSLIFMPESPRFLITKKKYDEARKAFNLIAKMNGIGENKADEFRFKDDMTQEESIKAEKTGILK